MIDPIPPECQIVVCANKADNWEVCLPRTGRQLQRFTFDRELARGGRVDPDQEAFQMPDYLLVDRIRLAIPGGAPECSGRTIKTGISEPPWQ
ncbi:hypothetical protein [Rhizobium laguerreae]|uniref:hypothetical protein n=1 Tax=Rhizobium laguerreae TaxID=1076926 RepID=UPI001FE300FB|nr:hypothetical protein [Rhizobium laguerreae]